MTVYTDINFRTKKALKEAVANWGTANKAVRCHQAGLGPDLSKFNGIVCISGPHYPQAHSWYATAVLQDGIVVKIT